jgi:hypothetical protein
VHSSLVRRTGQGHEGCSGKWTENRSDQTFVQRALMKDSGHRTTGSRTSHAFRDPNTQHPIQTPIALTRLPMGQSAASQHAYGVPVRVARVPVPWDETRIAACLFSRSDPSLTAASSRPAASSGFSCSQTRIAVQPTSARRRSVSRSRSGLRASLRIKYQELAFGLVPCSEHACQK